MEDFDMQMDTAPEESSAFLMEQLKSMMGKRQSALDQVKEIYANDPAAKRSPFQAGLRQLISDPAMGGRSTFSWGPAMGAMERQEQYQKQNKLDPLKLELENIDIDPFTKLHQKIKAGGAGRNCKVINGSLVCYDPQNNSVDEVYRDDKNSPLYAKMLDLAAKDSLNERLQFNSEEERQQWVIARASEMYDRAKGTDKTRIGSPDPFPAGGTPRAGMSGPQTIRQGMTPAIARPLPTESALKAAVGDFDPASDAAGVPEPVDMGGELGGEKDGYSFDPVLNKYVPSRVSSAAAVSPRMMTHQDLATQKEIGQLHAKENTADRQMLTDSRQMEQSLKVMQEIMNSGINTSGQAHELVNKFGGYLNYIDPNGTLAKSAGNDAVYFSNMMNLVRDKIAALGAGTAISNLDLIVTQKSVGDLRNTPEGNAKLAAIMELQNATMQTKLGGKLDYFDQNKSYDKYRGSGDPTHLVRASRLPSGDTRYWVQTREGWINERVKNGDYKSVEAAERAFNNAATQATAALIKGTGITFNKGQK